MKQILVIINKFRKYTYKLEDVGLIHNTISALIRCGCFQLNNMATIDPFKSSIVSERSDVVAHGSPIACWRCPVRLTKLDITRSSSIQLLDLPATERLCRPRPQINIISGVKSKFYMAVRKSCRQTVEENVNGLL